MNSEILVVGAGGNIGFRLALGLAKSREVIPAVHDHSPPQLRNAVRLDITRANDVNDLITSIRPRAVVNLAAMADADACERNPELARLVNVDGAAHVALACARAGARLVYYSTDLVFDGTKSFNTEDDPVNPLSLYGRTKLEGERVSLQLNPGMTSVLRTAIVYGKGSGKRPGFFESAMEKSRAGMKILAFTDQYRSFLFVEDSVPAVEGIIDNGLTGVYHAGGDARMSRYDFMRILFTKMNLGVDTLVPAKMSDIFGSAPRPADCTLSSGKLERATGWRPTPVEEGLDRFIWSLS